MKCFQNSVVVGLPDWLFTSTQVPDMLHYINIVLESKFLKLNHVSKNFLDNHHGPATRVHMLLYSFQTFTIPHRNLFGTA